MVAAIYFHHYPSQESWIYKPGPWRVHLCPLPCAIAFHLDASLIHAPSTGGLHLFVDQPGVERSLGIGHYQIIHSQEFDFESGTRGFQTLMLHLLFPPPFPAHIGRPFGFFDLLVDCLSGVLVLEVVVGCRLEDLLVESVAVSDFRALIFHLVGQREGYHPADWRAARTCLEKHSPSLGHFVTNLGSGEHPGMPALSLALGEKQDSRDTGEPVPLVFDYRTLPITSGLAFSNARAIAIQAPLVEPAELCMRQVVYVDAPGIIRTEINGHLQIVPANTDAFDSLWCWQTSTAAMLRQLAQMSLWHELFDMGCDPLVWTAIALDRSQNEITQCIAQLPMGIRGAFMLLDASESLDAVRQAVGAIDNLHIGFRRQQLKSIPPVIIIFGIPLPSA
jgi:hypothetical protein